MPVTKIRDDEILAGNRAVHAIEAQYYDRIHPDIFNFWEQRMLRRDLARALALLPARTLRVLDVGCGTGNLALPLWRLGHSVDAVDLSEEMLARLRGKQREHERLRLHCADADTFLRSAGSYDLIAISSVLHHLPDYTATLKRCAHLLVEGGALLVIHEPLPRTEMTSLTASQAAVSSTAAFIDRVRQRLSGIKLPAIDYSISDVHVEKGIALDALLTGLNAAGMSVVGLRRYRPERVGLAAMLHNAVLGAPPILFSLVAQRVK